MTYEVVDLEFDRNDHIATITLNRPQILNALNPQLVSELRSALDEVSGEFPEIRAVILTGAGRGFCSGADLSRSAERLNNSSGNSAPSPDWDSPSNIVTLAPHIQNVPQPVIGAINGIAAGGGLGLACACDIRIASELASFSTMFVKRSLVPDTGSSATLPRIIGHALTMEMSLTGRIYDSAWALGAGLVSQLVQPDQLMEAARAMASEIAANPPLAVRSIKGLLNDIDLHPIVRQESAANAPSTNSEDRREAVMSFLEKRKPVFRGR